jgi:hypothetical protein
MLIQPWLICQGFFLPNALHLTFISDASGRGQSQSFLGHNVIPKGEQSHTSRCP